MQFYGAKKKNEILSLASKWMEQENIILSELTLVQKSKNHMFSVYVDIRSRVNKTKGLDFDHMIKGEHIKEVWR
jgi:hypothetical protein